MTLFLVPTRQRGMHLGRARVHLEQADASASRRGSHAGAWESEKKVPWYNLVHLNNTYSTLLFLSYSFLDDTRSV